MDARIFFYGQSVFDVIAIEPDTLVTDRRYKGVLQQSDVVLVEVNVCEHIFHNSIDDIARLEQVVDSFRCLPHDNSLLRTGLTAIDFL